MNATCVIDIGGTNIRGALFYEGKLSEEIKYYKTPNYNFGYEQEEILSHLLHIIKKIYDDCCKKSNKEYLKIGIGFPGPVTSNGVIKGSSVIFGKKLTKDIYFKKLICKIIGHDKIKISNDMTAASYRYIEKYKRFVLITVSSGIGNKLVIDGKVIIDKDGRAGELGHVNVLDYDRLNIKCECGTGYNHIGSIASGRGIEEITNIMINDNSIRSYYNIPKFDIRGKEKLSAEEIAILADQGDFFIQKVIDFCIKPLAYSITLLLTTMDLEKVILIGGFILNCKYYFKSLVNKVKELGVYNFSKDELEKRIILGNNDDNHGLIGMGLFIGRGGDFYES